VDGKTQAHGVYARNAHGQEWLLRDRKIIYRTIGGSLDFYFLSGQDKTGQSSALETIRQFQVGCVGTPAMQMFWTFGFHQTRYVRLPSGYAETLHLLHSQISNIF
jgi:alpha-glucosidase